MPTKVGCFRGITNSMCNCFHKRSGQVTVLNLEYENNRKVICEMSILFNRPGVAGAVLQTPS